MLVGLLSDAHGNPLGLASCLAALTDAGAERMYFLGDAVGYLPGEAAVIGSLVSAGVICQRGNHEAMLLGALKLDPGRDEVYGLAAARERMSAGDLATIEAWPEHREIVLSGRRVLLVHGAPDDHLQGYVYPDADLDHFGKLGYDAVFMGNTHRPFVARRGGVLIANVGSCGLPRDQGDLPACVIYDAASHRCEVLRVPVPAASVTAQFGAVHPAVAECLRRTVPEPFGSIVRRP